MARQENNQDNWRADAKLEEDLRMGLIKTYPTSRVKVNISDMRLAAKESAKTYKLNQAPTV